MVAADPLKRLGWAPRLLLLLTVVTLSVWLLSGDAAGSLRRAAAGALPAVHLPAPSSSKVKIGWPHNLLASEGFGPRAPSGLTFKEAIPICTDNSGNLVWAYAARHLLDPNATELVRVRAPFNDTPITALLLPEANLLMNSSKYHMVESYTKHLLGVLRGVKAPVMLIGIGSQVRFEEAAGGSAALGGKAGGKAASLGSKTAVEGAAQADEAGDNSAVSATAHAAPAEADSSSAKPGASSIGTFDASRVTLDPEQVELLRRVEDSGGMTTVRGKFTAAIITSNSLKPPLSLGCPSFFLNHNPALGQVLQQKRDAILAARDPKLRVCVNLPNIPGDKPYPLKLIELLATRVLKRFPNSVVVLQTPRDEDTVDNMHRRHGLYLRTHRVRFFYDVESWIQGLRSACDFMFGFRIHGTMAAVAAEVPGMLIAPDMRVQELAEAMALPTVDMFDLTTLNMAGGKLDPESFDLFDFVEAARGYDGFDARRQQVARIYAAEFERLGVPAHPGLLNIASLADEEIELTSR